MNITTSLLLVYVSVSFSVLFFHGLKHIFKANKTPKTTTILLKAFFWPLFLFIRNPLTLFSETFFQSYGDGNVMYLGNSGLMNFLRDVFLGKNRYKNYCCGSATIPVPPHSSLAEKIEFGLEASEEEKKRPIA